MELPNGKKHCRVDRISRIRNLILPLLLLGTSTGWAQDRSAFTFFVYGDSRKGEKAHSQIVTAISQQDFAFVLNTGDLVSLGYLQAQWDECLQIIDPLNDSTLTPPVYLAAVGNHDITWESRDYSHWHHNLSWLPGNREFYYYDYENLRLIVLDSNRDPKSTAQLDSLRGWLAANTKVWIVVAWHHPTFPFDGSSVVQWQAEEWWPLLEQHHVDLVLNGHGHHYLRTRPLHVSAGRPVVVSPDSGIVEVITGGGGAPPHRIKKTDKNADYFETLQATGDDQHRHYCEVEVTEATLTITAKTAAGKVLDQFVIRK